VASESLSRTRSAAHHRRLSQIPLKPVVSVVIACYNEEGNLASYETTLLPALDAIGSPWEVILVDDGSTDNTAGNNVVS
jgi:cellulose synthase/poly-beta-1,6-N-acetylglucosamine synthase-like glycosyltransferase